MVNKYTTDDRTQLAGPLNGLATAGSEAAAQELVLLALAARFTPVRGWSATGISAKQLALLKQDQTTRLNELRALAALGAACPAALLADLLKARLAQRLLAGDNAAELERLAKIIERLPETAGQATGPAGATASLRVNSGGQRRPPSGKAGKDARHTGMAGTEARPTNDPDLDADVDNMELSEALAEAKRLITQLEEAPNG